MGIYTGTDLTSIPKKPGVYALVSHVQRAYRSPENIIYVGQTSGSESNGLQIRLKQHLVEETGTVIGDKWPVSIDKSQIDKIFWWVTEDLDIGRSPSDTTKIFEEYVKRQIKPMFRDRGGFAAYLEHSLSHPALDELFEMGRNETILPSYANLVHRIETLEATVQRMEQIITAIHEEE